jgi:hypothetical protein
MEEESSDEEWHEVDGPKFQAPKKAAVEIHVEKKKTEQMQEFEKLLRQEVERAHRLFQEESHKVHRCNRCIYFYNHCFSYIFTRSFVICATKCYGPRSFVKKMT